MMESRFFPTVTGENLVGDNFTLPFSLEGEFNVLLLAFNPSQYIELRSWGPVLDQAIHQYENLRYYELPTLDEYNEDQYRLLMQNMRQGVTDPTMREIVITLCVDKRHFLETLEIDSELTITVLLIDREGEIYWRTQGYASFIKQAQLRVALNRYVQVPQSDAD